MKGPLSLLFLLVTCASCAWCAEPQRVIIVVGALGAEEFAEPFQAWSHRWQAAANKATASVTLLGDQKDDDKPVKGQLREVLQQHGEKSSQPLWLILIGHGTFDGKTARFNLRGPDLSAAELKEMLEPCQSPLAIVNCSASSGPFLAELAAPGRVIITATQSGHEYNFAHFGDFLSAAIADPAADLDKDEQTSLLEAYLLAGSRLREFYKKDGRLATEHALLDDNGDKQGTPAEWFQGLRVVRRAKSGAAADGDFARQFVLVRSAREERIAPEMREQRDGLELQLAALREQKGKLSEAEYFAQLEPLLVQLAKLGQQTTDKVP